MINTKNAEIYNNVLNTAARNFPNIHCGNLDSETLDMIDTEIVTDENLWSVCVLLSTVTANSGKSVLHREDVIYMTKTGTGKDLVQKLRKKLCAYVNDDTNHLSVMEQMEVYKGGK